MIYRYVYRYVYIYIHMYIYCLYRNGRSPLTEVAAPPRVGLGRPKAHHGHHRSGSRLSYGLQVCFDLLDRPGGSYRSHGTYCKMAIHMVHTWCIHGAYMVLYHAMVIFVSHVILLRVSTVEP